MLAESALQEREILRLSSPVDPKGNVEEWLGKLEYAMRVSVRDGCQEASELAVAWAASEVSTSTVVRMLSA